MKRIATVFLAATVIVGAPARAQESENVARAKDAAKAWLALTDAGEYSRSWEQAADLFRAAITKTQWEEAVRAARSPLGSLRARQLKSAVFTRTLPGAPNGAYIVIQYETRFEHRAAAMETVTPLREKDGSWKVAGYFIR